MEYRWLEFAKGQRKDDMAGEYLARFPGREGVLFVGRAQEKTRVFRTEKRRNRRRGDLPVDPPWIVSGTGIVNPFYIIVNPFYIYAVDAEFGPFFIKFCSYFPYTAKLCFNGDEYAKRQAAKARIEFTALDNGLATCEDPGKLQQICEGLGPVQIDGLARKVADPAAAPVHRRRPGRRLPLRHLHAAGRVQLDPGAGPARH